ncbi:unnamed protein product [Peniophora sp. CBMAI 1063]|nr:unnamed protein product [Peniophora sp. CBMAI 1063]
MSVLLFLRPVVCSDGSMRRRCTRRPRRMRHRAGVLVALLLDIPSSTEAGDSPTLFHIRRLLISHGLFTYTRMPQLGHNLVVPRRRAQC